GEARRRAAACRFPRAPAAPRPPAAPRAPSLERGPLLLGGESVRELAELTLEHAVELVHRELDPVVGDPVLGEVVGADLLRALAAGPGGAVDVDLEVVRVDLDVDLLRLGHDRDRRRRGVDTALRLGLGDALDAVRAALELEHREGAVALHGEGDLLEAGAVAR